MPLRLRSRWVLHGLATLPMLTSLVGCQTLPLGPSSRSANRPLMESDAPLPPEPTSGSNPPVSLIPASQTTTSTAPGSKIEGTNPIPAVPAPAPALPPVGPMAAPTSAQAPSSTPLLDAARERSKAIEAKVAEELAASNKAPALRAPEVRTAAYTVPEVVFPTPDRVEKVAHKADANEPNRAEPAAKPIPETKPPVREPVDLLPPVPPATTQPLKPENLWGEGLQHLRQLARKNSSESDPQAPVWKLRALLLSWLSEPEIDPDADQSATGDLGRLRIVLRALISQERPTRGQEIRHAVDVLEAEAPLQVDDLRVCKKVEGFGQYEALEPASKKPGQRFLIYCELTGLRYEPRAEGFHSRLASVVELIPEGGTNPVWSHPLGTTEETCRRKRRDYYFNCHVAIPENTPPGRYKIRLSQTDLVANRSASREVAVTILP